MIDAEHVLIVGPSGGGKTTHARRLHAEHGGPSMFLTPDPGETTAEDDPGSYKYVRSPARYASDIAAAREWARRADAPVQVIVDEAQDAPSFVDGEGPLRDGLHRDRKAGVKWVVLTQNPMDLRTKENGYGPVQQAEYWVFCGPLRDWHVGFLNGNNLSGLIDLMPTEDYEYVVIRPVASLSPADKVVYRGTTDRRFADG